MEVNTVLS